MNNEDTRMLHGG